MAGLFEALTSATSALSAHRLGLDVTGHNMANVNTVGYSRRVLQLAEVSSADPRNAGRGVEVIGIRALRDEFLEARVRRETGAGAFNDAVIESLSTVEGAVGPAGSSLDARISEFFDAFAALADDVTSPAARDGVVEQGRVLAQAFGDLSSRLAQTRRDANLSIRGAVEEVNRLASEVAALNQQIMASGPETQALIDQRGVVLARLCGTGRDDRDGAAGRRGRRQHRPGPRAGRRHACVHARRAADRAVGRHGALGERDRDHVGDRERPDRRPRPLARRGGPGAPGANRPIGLRRRHPSQRGAHGGLRPFAGLPAATSSWRQAPWPARRRRWR